MPSIDFLEHAEIFRGLNYGQLSEIQQYCNVKEFRHGDRIFSEGEDATSLCIVMEGSVDLRFDLPGHITSDKNTISTVPKGKAFLWSSLVQPNKARLSSYCASAACKIVMVDRGKLMNFFEKDYKAGYIMMSNIAGVVAERFYKLQDEIVNRRGYEAMFTW